MSGGSGSVGSGFGGFGSGALGPDASGASPADRAARSWTPAALTIAGADSSGTAGLATDLRAFAASGVHGAFALTLVSAQNTREFRTATSVDAELLAAQIDAVLDDMPIAATKTGLMLTPETISVVAAAARRLPQLVVDPVLVNGAGQRLLDESAVEAISTRLLPHARVTTPNHLEAGLLVGRDLGHDQQSWIDAAFELAEIGPEAVLVTGGRVRSSATDGQPDDLDTVIDVVVIDGQAFTLEAPRQQTPNVRGAGDVLSAVICAELAKGTILESAIEQAHGKAVGAIAGGSGLTLGSGPGPVDPNAPPLVF